MFKFGDDSVLNALARFQWTAALSHSDRLATGLKSFYSVQYQ